MPKRRRRILTNVFVLDGAFAQENDGDLERQHPDLAASRSRQSKVAHLDNKMVFLLALGLQAR